jgi:hypothetical protein
MVEEADQPVTGPLNGLRDSAFSFDKSTQVDMISAGTVLRKRLRMVEKDVQTHSNHLRSFTQSRKRPFAVRIQSYAIACTTATRLWCARMSASVTRDVDETEKDS